MEKIIVTVCDPKKMFLVDLELPTNLIMKDLCQSIVEVLKQYKPGLNLNRYETKIYSNRYKRVLKEQETLHQAGIWNGDYLILISE